MALMRGILGADAEVGVIASITPAGIAQPIAILVTPEIADELALPEDLTADEVVGSIGGGDVAVLLDSVDGATRPIAIRVNPWIFHNLTMFARKVWSQRRPL
ncbi:MAG TPA: hypothetical protein VHA79_00800 [Mycobacteriales bacterium]|jgi:hypothetical protein|nr:hypothetical protein [Mycobacteriales bacterium]